MKKKAIFISCLLAIMIGVTGCGKQAETPEVSETTTQAETTTVLETEGVLTTPSEVVVTVNAENLKTEIDLKPISIDYRSLCIASMLDGWNLMAGSGEETDTFTEFVYGLKEYGDPESTEDDYFYVFMNYTDANTAKGIFDETVDKTVLPVQKTFESGNIVGIDASDTFFSGIQYDTYTLSALGLVETQDNIQNEVNSLYETIAYVKNDMPKNDKAFNMASLDKIKEYLGVNGFSIEESAELDECLKANIFAADADDTIEILYYDFADIPVMYATMAMHLMNVNPTIPKEAITEWRNGLFINLEGTEWNAVCVQQDSKVLLFVCDKDATEKANEICRILTT